MTMWCGILLVDTDYMALRRDEPLFESVFDIRLREARERDASRTRHGKSRPGTAEWSNLETPRPARLAKPRRREGSLGLSLAKRYSRARGPSTREAAERGVEP